MTVPTLRLAPVDSRALAQEFDSNLQYGRAFAEAADGIDVLADCILVVVHPESASEIKLPAQAVMVTPAGIGIELRPFDNTIRERIREFVVGQLPENNIELEDAAAAVAEPVEAGEHIDSLEQGAAVDAEPCEPLPQDDEEPDATLADELEPALTDVASEPEAVATATPLEPASAPRESDPDAQTPAVDETRAAVEAGAEVEDAFIVSPTADADAGDEPEPEPQQDDNGRDDPAPDPEARQHARPRHEQLRNLNSAEQHRLARKGELNDRVILERLYGKNVWEQLLHNPRLTIPEVARIARKGTVPRPLLELIADNNSWIQAPIVRRALLTNPRVRQEAVIMKLLRITPRHELKTIVKTSTYTGQVRELAKRLLG